MTQTTHTTNPPYKWKNVMKAGLLFKRCLQSPQSLNPAGRYTNWWLNWVNLLVKGYYYGWHPLIQAGWNKCMNDHLNHNWNQSKLEFPSFKVGKEKSWVMREQFWILLSTWTGCIKRVVTTLTFPCEYSCPLRREFVSATAFYMLLIRGKCLCTNNGHL